MSKSSYQHAIVIGGSIAGLTTAHVLSEYFEQVTVIERDHRPVDMDFRKGVPQSKHPHVLLRRGLLGLETLFPGFEKEIGAAGAVTIDFGKNVEWYAFGKWRPHYEPGLTTLGTSRPLLEATIRRRVERQPKITFMDHTEVIGLIANPDRTKATGVRVRSRDVGQLEKVHEADLVVDASGRDSHAHEWLENLGYSRPKTTTINAFPGYASRLYELPPGTDFTLMYIQPAPPKVKRGAASIALEGNRAHVALVGMAKDYPPTDEDDFLNFLAGLPDKRLYDVIKRAKPVSPIVGYRRAENVLHHYHEQARWLDNFILIGDSVYTFNPVYGQGMTIAIKGALKLADLLSEQVQHSNDLSGLAMRFQQALGKTIEFPWKAAIGEDTRWLPITEGVSKPDFQTSMRLGLMKKVMVASTKDPKVAEVFYRVLNMVASPAELFKPGMLVRILTA
jgi:2-polyprenyl-6-methoxyphenol hydroxylase-like FAD-dependent oxidoreductase